MLQSRTANNQQDIIPYWITWTLLVPLKQSMCQHRGSICATLLISERDGAKEGGKEGLYQHEFQVLHFLHQLSLMYRYLR